MIINLKKEFHVVKTSTDPFCRKEYDIYAWDLQNAVEVAFFLLQNKIPGYYTYYINMQQVNAVCESFLRGWELNPYAYEAIKEIRKYAAKVKWNKEFMLEKKGEYIIHKLNSFSVENTLITITPYIPF